MLCLYIYVWAQSDNIFEITSFQARKEGFWHPEAKEPRVGSGHYELAMAQCISYQEILVERKNSRKNPDDNKRKVPRGRGAGVVVAVMGECFFSLRELSRRLRFRDQIKTVIRRKKIPPGSGWWRYLRDILYIHRHCCTPFKYDSAIWLLKNL